MPAARLASLGGHTMGTQWSARIYAAPTLDLHPIHATIQAQLDQVVAQMSTWEADSDISRYRNAAAGCWQSIPDAFATVLDCALEVAESSKGAFDPTIGPLVDLWGFGSAGGPRRVPGAQAITEALARIGWQRLQRRGRQLLQPGSLQLDLSGIAKGFGADLVAEHLRARGIATALIEVGGEIRAYGLKPDMTPWRVLVETELDEGADLDEVPARVLELSDLAVATSGDRWHRFEEGGVRYAHTLDPRSGTPVERAAASVTVIETTAMRADAWATALTVMGPEEGMAFATRQGLAVRYVWRDQHQVHEHMSPAFQHHLAT